MVQQKGPISKSAGSHHKTLSDVQKEAVRKRVQVQGDGDGEGCVLIEAPPTDT